MTWERFLTACVLTFLLSAVMVAEYRIEHLGQRVQQLEYACMPVDTGGGVTQCLQPNVQQTSGR